MIDFYESNRGNPEWHYVSPALVAPEGSLCAQYHLVIEVIDWLALDQRHPSGRYTCSVFVVAPDLVDLESVAQYACISMEEMHSHWAVPVLEVSQVGYRASVWETSGNKWKALLKEAKAFCGEGLSDFALHMEGFDRGTSQTRWQACGVK